MPRKKSAAKKAREAAKKENPETGVVKNAAEPSASKTIVVEKSGNSSPESVEVQVSDEESSTSEDEDDYGDLITEEVEEGIQSVLAAIKNNEMNKLLDPKVRFFENPEKAVENIIKDEKQKPVYLKDYHRMNLLNGGEMEDEDTDSLTVDGKQSYVSQQKEERSQLLSEINEAFNVKEESHRLEGGSDDDSDEDDFLKKKEHVISKEQKVNLPDPEKNDEEFLSEFIKQHAWIPQKGDKTVDLDRVNVMEEDDEEFEDAVEKFENAYNFRYEDPNAAEIVSYARTQATLRRSTTSSRRRKRDEEKSVKQKEKKDKEKAVQKKKKEKINQLTDVLEQVKKEYGSDISEDRVKTLTETLLNGKFEDDKWDEVIGQIFNDEFYAQEGKPTWDEDDEIMGELYEQDSGAEDELGQDENVDFNEQDTSNLESSNKKSKKEKKEDKKSKKKEKKHLSEMVEKAVEENKLAIIEKVDEERGRTSEKEEIKFRYREVSPESFGLTTREIFTADDNDLNEFIGLKKFAPYRPKELRAKDKRKVTKNRRIREWRKKVFSSEDGLNGDELSIPLESGSKVVGHSGHKEKKKSKKRKRED